MAGWLQFSSPRQGKDSWTEVSRYTESVTSSVSDAELRTAASESGSSVSGAPFEARALLASLCLCHLALNARLFCGSGSGQ